MRVVAIIQARIGSSRLRGKVLMPLAGRPVLWHVIHRLRQCRSLDDTVIAMSAGHVDDPIEEFGRREGVRVFRGPEENVLLRYAMAAEESAADVIVRVNADAPLIDPAMLDRLVYALERGGADFATGDPGVPSIHEGFDALTFRSLRRLVDEVGEDPVAREHVTGYFKKHPGFVGVVHVAVDDDCRFAGAGVSVDAPADLRFLQEIYDRLGVPAGDADVRDVVRLLRSEPGLLRINAHVHQKGVEELSQLVVFRCDGDADLGLGHVYRSIALADELRDRHGCGVRFALVRGDVGAGLIRNAGYELEQKADDLPEDLWLDEVIARLRPRALVLDVRSVLSKESVDAWRTKGVLIATVDDSSQRRLAADLAFYPPVPQVERMDWAGFAGKRHVGWEWVVLRRQFSDSTPRVPHDTPAVLVTMGGSDPAGLTLKALAALELLDGDFATVVVLGAGFAHEEALGRLMSSAHRRFELHRNVDDMAAMMRSADLALASFGVTAYELAASGVPSVHICLTQDHVEAASAFSQEGIAVCLGVHTAVTPAMIASEVAALLRVRSALSRMGERSRSLVDGLGARRIAAMLAERMEAHVG